MSLVRFDTTTESIETEALRPEFNQGFVNEDEYHRRFAYRKLSKTEDGGSQDTTGCSAADILSWLHS